MTSPFRQLFSLNVADLESAASAWRTLGDRLGRAQTLHRRQVTGPLETGWEGHAAKEGMNVLTILQGQLEASRVDAVLMAKVLDTVRVRLTQAQTDLRNAVRSAEQEQYVVDGDTGQVKLPQWLVDLRHEPDQAALISKYSEGLRKYQEAIDKAVKDARKASDDGRKALLEFYPQGLRREDALGATAKAAKGVARDLGIGSYGWPKGGDAKENAAWWKGLGRDRQQLFIAMYPDKVGNMNGLPAAARDDANRLLIDQMLNPTQPDHAVNPDHFNKQRDNLLALKRKLDEADSAPEQRRLYLLRVDPAEFGRAVIAMGNPDTADNTAVLVPGTNSNVEKISGQLDRLRSLQTATDGLDPSKKTAVISWMDYEAPQFSPGERLDVGVAATNRAEEGGEALRDFTAGVRAAQDGRPARLTVIGHSYGSTTVGAGAAGGSGLEADGIVVLGSPGTTVESARELHMDPKHVYAGAADDDPIVGYFSDKSLGADPTTRSFGGQRIVTDTSGHSGYWDVTEDGRPSESLANQARIITGKNPTTAEPKEIPFGRQGYDAPFPHVPQGIK